MDYRRDKRANRQTDGHKLKSSLFFDLHAVKIPTFPWPRKSSNCDGSIPYKHHGNPRHVEKKKRNIYRPKLNQICE